MVRKGLAGVWVARLIPAAGEDAIHVVGVGDAGAALGAVEVESSPCTLLHVCVQETAWMSFSFWMHAAVPAGSTQSAVGKENCALIPRARTRSETGS